MININLTNTGRIVRDVARVDIFLQEVVPTQNFTSINNSLDSTATSGTLLTSTMPVGLNIFNRNIGAITEYDITTSGFVTTFPKISFETNFRRADTSVSGSKFIGRT